MDWIIDGLYWIELEFERIFMYFLFGGAIGALSTSLNASKGFVVDPMDCNIVWKMGLCFFSLVNGVIDTHYTSQLFKMDIIHDHFMTYSHNT